MDLSRFSKDIRVGIYLADEFCKNADQEDPDLIMRKDHYANFDLDLNSNQQEAFLEFVFSYIHVKFEENKK